MVSTFIKLPHSVLFKIKPIVRFLIHHKRIVFLILPTVSPKTTYIRVYSVVSYHTTENVYIRHSWWCLG